MKHNSTSFSRVNRTLTEAERYYSRLSPFYDLLASSEKKFINRGLDLLDPQPDEKILEVGSGTGFAQIILTSILENGLSVGLDLSKGMCQIASRNLTRRGLSHLSNLIRSDTLPVPFQAGVFDAVFTSFTLELFDSPQIPKVLEDCRRVLKPGGRMVVVALSKDQTLPWGGRLYEWLHDRFPRLLDCRPIPARTLLEKAGFEIVECQSEVMWGLPMIILLAKIE
jgi:demethylmenaquinone methyltransferase/2-methoxy-6-polyprenyl-1,4-benzoquinol methylase